MLIPHSLSRKLWIPFLACVLLIPTISWSMNAPFAVGLQSSFTMLTLIGQITGIIGSQLFATALLLSARLKSVEYLFGGLDKMYVIHHRIGTIAFSFLAIHPLVLAFRYLADSVEDVMWFLIPLHKETPWYEIMPKDFGIYALWSMFVLLFVTFYGATFKYPSLKTAHRFMGAAFFLAGLHMFYIPSSMSSDIVLKIACLGMASLGIIAYTYRTLLGRFLVPRYKYTVSKVFDVGQGVTEITLLPSKKALTHIPGQFAMLSFFGAKVVSDEEHPFTISGGPRGGELQFSIKSLGDYTTALTQLPVGTQAKIEGPFGEFTYGYGSHSQIWIAGGIGVTPFVSMAEDLLGKQVIDYTIDFFYSARSEHDGVYRELFTKVQTKHPSFVFHFMPSDTAGFVTGESVIKTVPDTYKRDIFICGPPPMMSALTTSLVTSGVSLDRIRSERFSLLK